MILQIGTTNQRAWAPEPHYEQPRGPEFEPYQRIRVGLPFEGAASGNPADRRRAGWSYEAEAA